MALNLYRALQEVFIAQTGLKVGSRVRVTRNVPDRELTWSEWFTGMNAFVGNEYDVHNISSNGIFLDKLCTFYFPFFVLEIISIEPKPKVVKIPITSEVVASIASNHIWLEVNEQAHKMSFETLDKIVETANKLRKKELHFADIEVGRQFTCKISTGKFLKVTELTYRNLDWASTRDSVSWVWPNYIVERAD